MPTHVKLANTKAERFRHIKYELAEQWGYEPSNPEVIGYLMTQYYSR
jgi:hypothetical protein